MDFNECLDRPHSLDAKSPKVISNDYLKNKYYYQL